MPISRRRKIERASIAPATFAQAMRSTSTTPDAERGADRSVVGDEVVAKRHDARRDGMCSCRALARSARVPERYPAALARW